MGGRSRSSTQSTQETQVTNIQDIDTTTVGLEDVQDTQIALGDQTITQISTDQGAVEAGRAIGEASLDFAGEFGGVAIEAVSDATDRALDFGADFGSQAFGFGERALETVEAQSERTTKELGGAITRAAEATRSDSAVVTQNIAKYGAIAVGVIGVAIVLVFVFK